jgi:hypothetical protein
LADPDEIFDQLSVLEDQLMAAIQHAKAGEFDGNEIGPEEFVLYMYGPDAEQLFKVVEPILRSSELVREATALIRPGPPGTAASRVRLGRGELGPGGSF